MFLMKFPILSKAWYALLYLCNARIAPRASWDALACARLSLDRGGDPRTHALMYQMRYTAITGVVDVGEAGPVAAPPHPQARALVELLLDAGADPNDEQVFYNVHFLHDEGRLELLARGLRDQVRLDPFRPGLKSREPRQANEVETRFALSTTHPI
jgi:hypothetical protein